MNIKNKVAVITGAAGGIGRAVAIELARRGAKAVALSTTARPSKGSPPTSMP